MLAIRVVGTSTLLPSYSWGDQNWEGSQCHNEAALTLLSTQNDNNPNQNYWLCSDTDATSSRQIKHYAPVREMSGAQLGLTLQLGKNRDRQLEVCHFQSYINRMESWWTNKRCNNTYLSKMEVKRVPLKPQNLCICVKPNNSYFKDNFKHILMHTHTNTPTHTYIYIYIYIYVCMYL